LIILKNGIKKELKMQKTLFKQPKKNNIFRTPIIPKHITHAFYKLYLFVNGCSKLRDELLYKINKQGVPCYTGGCSEIYREKAFGSYKKGYLKTAAELGDTSLMFLVHPTLTKNEINKTCEVINSIK
jgi:dTDP-4-amino-4,6-dideoxygalactose transaminase